MFRAETEMSTHTTILCIFALSVLITTEAEDTNSKGLGLLFETGEIIVSKNSEHVRFGLFITANYSKEDLNAELTTAVKEVRKIKEIPGVKSDPKKTTKIVQVLLQIDRMVNVIRKTLSELLTYSDPTQISDFPEYQCSLILPVLSKETVKEMADEITTVVEQLDLNVDNTKMKASKGEFRTILDSCHTIISILTDFRQVLSTRKDTVSGLSNNMIPDHLPTLLEL